MRVAFNSPARNQPFSQATASETPMQPLDWLQFWDCFSYEMTVTVFERLQDSRVRVQFKDRSWEGGQYMFTFDWCESEDAEEAGDGGHKCGISSRSIMATSRLSRTIAFSGFAR